MQTAHKRTKTFFHQITHENATITTTRPSSDFSSAGPSQPTSHVILNHAHKEQSPPEPATIHLVMNAPAFGEPISPSIATTTTVAAPAPPAESNTTRPRPFSRNSTTTTTTGSSMGDSVTTPATYTLETIVYAQAIPLRSGALVTKEEGKAKGHTKQEPLRSRMRCSKMKIYTQAFLRRMRLRAMRQGYRLQGRRGSISTAGIQRRSRPSSGVISRSQLANYEIIATCPSCSLIIRVIFDQLGYEDEHPHDGREREEETGEEKGDEDLFKDGLERPTIADEPAPKAVVLSMWWI